MHVLVYAVALGQENSGMVIASGELKILSCVGVLVGIGRRTGVLTMSE